MADFPALEGTEFALALIDAGELAHARVIAEGLVRRTPGHPTAQFLAGAVALKEERLADAAAAFAASLDLDPANVMVRDILEGTRIKLARQLLRDGFAEAARAELGKANAARPDGVFAVLQAGTWLDPIPAGRAELDAARSAYAAAVRALADLDAPIDPARILQAGTQFLAPYQGHDIRPWQEAIAAFYRRNCPSLSYRASHIDDPPGGTLRIGFVSAHFFNHTVAKLFRGIVRGLDRTKFHVTVLFAGASRDDEYRRALVAESDDAVSLPESLAEARAAIAAARLDILVYTDIGMEPLTYFLAFARLARLQMMGWGHGVTSGITSIDGFISSVDLEEPGPHAQAHYTERLHRLSLPPTYLFAPPAGSPDDAPDLSFARGRAIYCCPQTLFKIHPDFDPLLLDILARDPEGVLVMIDADPGPGWAARLRARLRLAERGLTDRLVFLPRLDQAEFMGLLAAATVVLDTTYFTGGISTVEALTQGAPVVTWPNTPLLCARVSTAYYREMGMMDCVVDSADDYVALAVRLGTDPVYRAEVSERIRANLPKLFRRTEVLRELEDIFVEEWRARRDSNSQPSDP